MKTSTNFVPRNDVVCRGVLTKSSWFCVVISIFSHDRESEQKSSKLSTDSISISQSLVHPNLLSQQTEPEKSRNEPRSDSINAETNEQLQSLTGQASDNW